MLNHDINVEQYNHSPVQVEYQIPVDVTPWQQQQLISFEDKINFFRLNEDSRKILLDTINTLKIPITLATEFFALCKRSIYLIIDDSQSMATEDTELFDQQTGKQLTRIEELKIRLRSIATILCTLAKFDIKIITLSNFDFIRIIPKDLPVHDKIQQFNLIIESLVPTSSPYLISATTVAIKDAEDVYTEQNVKSILYVFTNGKPNDQYEGKIKRGFDGFIAPLENTNLFTKDALLIACSGCSGGIESIKWLKKSIIRSYSHEYSSYTDIALNIQGDFILEAKNIYYIHGKLLPFDSYGFYIAIGLLAPVTPWLDKILTAKYRQILRLTKSELSILINRQTSIKSYSEYNTAVDNSIGYYDIENLDLKIISIDGKTYAHKVLPKNTHNKTTSDIINDSCIIL